MQYLEISSGYGISSAFSPKSRYTDHNGVTAKFAIFQEIQKLRAFSQSIFSAISVADPPDGDQWLTFMPDVLAIVDKIVSLFQILVIFHHNTSYLTRTETR